MKKQGTVPGSLVLALTFYTIMIGLVAVQTMWVYAQGNLSQVLNQTRNQTGNQSLSPAFPGQQGGTPPISPNIIGPANSSNITDLNSNITNRSSNLNTTIPEQLPLESINGSKIGKI
jgi:hypothetical protein